MLDSINPFSGTLSPHDLVLRAFRMTLVFALVGIPVYGLLIARIDGLDSWTVRWAWTGAAGGLLAVSYTSAWVQRRSGLILGVFVTGLNSWLGVLAMINGLSAEMALTFTVTYVALGIVFGIAFDTIRPLLVYIGISTAIAVGLVATTPVLGVDSAVFLFGFSLAGLMLLAGTYNRLNDRAELQAQTRLLTSAERLGELGSWSHNLETDERRWSNGMFDLVGVPRQHGEPPRLTDFAEPNSRKDIERQESALVHGDIDANDARYRIVRDDGAVRQVRSITQLLRTDDGTPRRLIGAVVDVTNQSDYASSLEQARREAETAVALKSALLTNMSYHIRTPLTAVIGFARLLDDELKGLHRDLVEPITTGGEQLLSSLDTLLQFARLEAGEIDLKPQPVNVAAEVAALVPSFWRQATAKGLAFDVVTPEAPVYALATPGELGVVLGHLVANAIALTASGGITLGILQTFEASVIIVRDTGEGIAPDALEHVFDPFRREAQVGRTEGTGLGLAIAHRLVHAMGGTIEADSMPGSGSVFTIRLPRAEPPAPEASGTVWVSLASRLGASGETTPEAATAEP